MIKSLNIRFLSIIITSLLGITPLLSSENNNLISDTPPPILDLNGIAAIAEDQIITFNEVYQELLPLLKGAQAQSKTPEEYQERIHVLQEEILQNLIDRVLIVKEFTKQGFQIPDAIFESELEEYIQSTFGDDRSLFLRYIDSQGKDLRQFRKEFKDHLIVTAMRAKKQKSQSEISPDKIEQYYHNNPNQFKQEKQVKLRQVILSASSEEPIEAIRAKAQSLLAKFKEEPNFTKLTQSCNQDNDLGWVQYSDMIPILSDVAFGLQPGQCSEAIEIDNRIFILYVEGQKEAGIQPLDEVREQIEFILNHNLSKQNIEKWLEGLRQKAFVKRY